MQRKFYTVLHLDAQPGNFSQKRAKRSTRRTQCIYRRFKAGYDLKPVRRWSRTGNWSRVIHRVFPDARDLGPQVAMHEDSGHVHPSRAIHIEQSNFRPFYLAQGKTHPDVYTA